MEREIFGKYTTATDRTNNGPIALGEPLLGDRL